MGISAPSEDSLNPVEKTAEGAVVTGTNDLVQRQRDIIELLDLNISPYLSEEDFLDAYRAASAEILVRVHESRMKASRDDMYRARS